MTTEPTDPLFDTEPLQEEADLEISGDISLLQHCRVSLWMEQYHGSKPVEETVNADLIALEESFRLVIAQWNVPVARRLGALTM
ncbi:unnamed protein product [Penicillium camemberti]|uniref:Str. FM013 n=1 Tax=Penicillium camemberti (strain FM 013) TaxID=1429867 RepID=A0A0G4PUG0_PENC3|nr:unnamed protein product [Penicillium camemberti]